MASIRYFKLVGEVIEVNIQHIARQRGITNNDAYQEVVDHLYNNSWQWRSGQQPQIPYNDPLCRIAYLYGIVPANANLIEFVFEQDTELQDYFDERSAENGKVSVCAFGGGPGTELLGLAKWIENRRLRQQFTVEFLLLDRETAWMDSWRAIRRKITERFRQDYGSDRREWPLQISAGDFSNIDLTNPIRLDDYGNLFDQDLFILSYVISEIFDEVESLRDFAALIVDQAPAGAKFLFIDRNQPRWRNEVEELAYEAGIELGRFHTTNTSMSTDEQKTALGQIYLDVGRDPRVTWDAFWVVGTKDGQQEDEDEFFFS